MTKTKQNAPEKWGVNKPKKLDKTILIPAKWNDEDVNSFLELIKEFSKQSKDLNTLILTNKQKKIAFLSFYAKNKRIINISAYAESIGVDRRTIYNWINGYYKS
jgi:hypothetical protein